MKPQNKYLLKSNMYLCVLVLINIIKLKKKNVDGYWSTIDTAKNTSNKYVNLKINFLIIKEHYQ